jgi:Secretion system C-terminal sorting domain
VGLAECKYVYYGYGSNCTTLTATATGGGGTYTFRWNSGTVSGATLNVCPTRTTEYEVTVTDQYGCKEDEDVTVKVIDVRCGNKNDKVQICHNGNTLCVSPDAVPAHLAHGDKLGTCGSAPCSSNDNASLVASNTNNALIASNKNKPTNFTVFPNPAHNEAWVNLTSFEGQAVTLVVTDILGKTVQQTVIPQASSEPQRLDTAQLPTGLYLVKVQTTGSQMQVRKLQITK